MADDDEFGPVVLHESDKTPLVYGAWVTYADHAVEVARLREEVARRTEDQVAAEAELYTVRAAALQEVRERIAEFDPESKPFIADEIYRILDEVEHA